MADGTACYACGYEWPAESAPAPTTPPPPAAAPPPPAQPHPPPIEDIDFGLDEPPPPGGAASSASNPFSSPRPVTGTFPNPGKTPPPANPFQSSPGVSNPFGTGQRTEAAAPTGGNPFASADGPLSAHRPASNPDIPKATASAPMAFDPFEGDSLPPAPPPPPLDLEAEPFGEEVAFDDDLDLDGPPPAPAPAWDASESTELLPKHAPDPAGVDVPFSMAPTHVEGAAETGFDDVDVDGLDVGDEPTVDTEHTPAALVNGGAAQEPLSERLILLAAELDAEGRHDDANLLHEAVRALASQKR